MTAGKAGHRTPSCLHDDQHCLDSIVRVLYNSLRPKSDVHRWMEYPPVDMQHLIMCHKHEQVLVFACVFGAGAGTDDVQPP